MPLIPGPPWRPNHLGHHRDLITSDVDSEWTIFNSLIPRLSSSSDKSGRYHEERTKNSPTMRATTSLTERCPMRYELICLPGGQCTDSNDESPNPICKPLALAMTIGRITLSGSLSGMVWYLPATRGLLHGVVHRPPFPLSSHFDPAGPGAVRQ